MPGRSRSQPIAATVTRKTPSDARAVVCAIADVAFVSCSSGTATGRAAGKRGRSPRGTVIALVILVFVDAQDAATPLPGALARAAEEALGSDASVSIRTARERSADAGARRRGPRGARDCRGAESRGRTSSAPKRASTSSSTDGGPARSVHARVRRLRSRSRSADARSVSCSPRLLAPENQARLERARSCTPTSRPPPPRSRARRRRRPSRRAASRWMPPRRADFAVGGAGSGAGGAIGLRWQPGSRFGLRVGVHARFGEVGVAQAAAMDLGRGGGRRPVPHPAVGSTTVRPRAARRRAPALRVAVPPVAG